MKEYITLAAAMVLLPAVYWGVMTLRHQRVFRTLKELAVMLSAEAALIRIWQNLGRCPWHNMRFQLQFVILAGMTVLCITDYRERIVPNQVLLVLLMLYLVILGFQSLEDMGTVLEAIPSIVLGLLFSVITFGLGYLLSHGGMGAGDVKLALVMGLYLTGEYVPGAVFYGCVAGAVYSLVQIFRKKLSRKDQLPFVPFLYIGLIIRYIL